MRVCVEFVHQWREKMELKDHVAKLMPTESPFEQDMTTASLEAIISVARKHSNYDSLAEALLAPIDMRGNFDVDPLAYDAAMQSLIEHVLEECPPVRPIFQSLLKEEYPELIPMFFATPPHTPVKPSPTSGG